MAIATLPLLLVLAGVALLAVLYGRQVRLARLFFALPASARRKILRSPSLLRLEGERRKITYLSCRIANMDELEQAFSGRPAQLAALLEKRLSGLRSCALEQGGAIERTGSTGFAAFWNAPLDEPQHTGKALAAACRMMRYLAEQSEVHRGAPLKLHIGIASGEAIAGFIGGAYSVSGACVRRAEDLRAACGRYGFAALADDETAAHDFALLKIDRSADEKFGTPAIHALLGDRSVRASPTFRALSAYHERIFAALDTNRHEEARLLMSQAAALSGASRKLYDLYAERTAPLKQAS